MIHDSTCIQDLLQIDVEYYNACTAFGPVLSIGIMKTAERIRMEFCLFIGR